jgi:hypothetical protein
MRVLIVSPITIIFVLMKFSFPILKRIKTRILSTYHLCGVKTTWVPTPTQPLSLANPSFSGTLFHLSLVHRSRSNNKLKIYSISCSNHFNLLYSVPNRMTYLQLYRTILLYIRRYLKKEPPPLGNMTVTFHHFVSFDLLCFH